MTFNTRRSLSTVGPNNRLLRSTLTLLIASGLPIVDARRCFYDEDGFLICRENRLSTGARIAIAVISAVTLIVLFIIFYFYYRRGRTRQQYQTTYLPSQQVPLTSAQYPPPVSAAPLAYARSPQQGFAPPLGPPPPAFPQSQTPSPPEYVHRDPYQEAVAKV